MASLLTKAELADKVRAVTDSLQVMPDDAKYCPACDTIYDKKSRTRVCWCDYESDRRYE